MLTLVTCLPFNVVAPGEAMRYFVRQLELETNLPESETHWRADVSHQHGTPEEDCVAPDNMSMASGLFH